jgi:hypothetical protein
MADLSVFVTAATLVLSQTLGPGLDLSANITESLKVSDVQTARRYGDANLGGLEDLALSEQLTVRRYGDANLGTVNKLKISDTLTVRRYGDANLGAPEDLALSDSVSAVIDASAYPNGDLLAIGDSNIQAALNPLVAEPNGQVQTASDNFNRADSHDVGANWTQQLADSGSGCNLAVVGNQAAIDVAAKAAAAFYNAISFANDQWASCRIFSQGGSFLGGPMVRSSGALSTSFTNYEAYISSITNLRFSKHINGTPTTLLNITGSFADGDVIRLEVSGQTLRAYQNGVLLGTFVDASIASGSPGIILHAGGPVDDFQAGELTHTETLRLSDGPVTASLSGPVDLSASVTEALKLTDGGIASSQGIVKLVGPVRVIDGPALVTLNPLQANPSESLKLSDVAAGFTDPSVILSEPLKLSDAVSVSISPLQAAVAGETVHVSDSVTASIGGALSVNASELLKLADGGAASQQGVVELIGPVRVVDGPVVAALDNNVLLAEALKVSDAVTATIPGGGDLAANVTEVLKLSESPSVALDLQSAPSEALKLSDVALTTLDPLQTSLSESLKITDAVTAGSGILASVPDETLKLSDAVSAVVDAQVAVGQETVRILDSVIAQRYGDVRVADEILKISDSVSASRDIEAVLSEGLKLSEELAAVVGSGVFTTETLKLSDVIIAQLDQFPASASETLKLSDSVTASRDIEASPSETLKLSDGAPGTLLFPEQSSPTEQLKITDSVTAAIDELAVAAETLKISDQVTASFDATGVQLTETLKISDALTVSIDLVVSRTESLKLSEAPALLENPLQAQPTEAFRLAEELVVAPDLIVSLSETVHITDRVASNPVFIDVAGSYQTTIDVAGSYQTTIDVAGDVG